MSKKMYFLVPLVILLSGGSTLIGIGLYKEYTKPIEVHLHAGFQVYEDGKLQDFSGSEFMNEKPCSIDDGSPVDEQLEKAHLHDGIGDVVHVHRDHVLWSDLFDNLGYSFSVGKKVRSFVNGKEVDDILNFPIKPYDSIVIFVGEIENFEKKLEGGISKDRILEAENMPESCGK